MEERKDGFKPVIMILTNKEGQHKIDTAPGITKEVIVSMLADALKKMAMVPNNITNVPAGLSAGGVRNFINRTLKKKRNGGFGS